MHTNSLPQCTPHLNSPARTRTSLEGLGWLQSTAQAFRPSEKVITNPLFYRCRVTVHHLQFITALYTFVERNHGNFDETDIFAPTLSLLQDDLSTQWHLISVYFQPLDDEISPRAPLCIGNKCLTQEPTRMWDKTSSLNNTRVSSNIHLYLFLA